MRGYHSAPKNYGKVDFSVNKLLFAGGVLFGSRALNVETADSDYDIAILHSNLNTLLSSSPIKLVIVPLENHFEVVPPYGHNYLIKGLEFTEGPVDIIVLEHQEHLDMIRKSTGTVLQSTSNLLLKDKDIRRLVYMKAMKQHGFGKPSLFRRLYNYITNKGSYGR